MISKATCEAAIEALRCEADEWFADVEPLYITEEDDDVDNGLVSAAMEAVRSITNYENAVEIDILEAAALLEDGWSPGDPVRRIG